jgi:hypothetical protein
LQRTDSTAIDPEATADLQPSVPRTLRPAAGAVRATTPTARGRYWPGRLCGLPVPALRRIARSVVVDRPTTERPEPADNAHHRHIPADAETLAWNRAREAQWHAAPSALEATLRELAPAVFNDCPPPLAVGIDGALIALVAGEFEAEVVGRFLRDWVHRPAYLAAVARGDVRRDLDGCPTEAPDAVARTFAAVLLGRRGDAPP